MRLIHVVGALAVSLTAAACGTASPAGRGDVSAAEAMSPAVNVAPHKSIVVAPIDWEVSKLTAFLSPSGNVGCMIAPSGVGCNIVERDWSPPPRPADCKWDYTRISVEPSKPGHFVCAGDSVHDSAAPTLAYGEAITGGPIRCESAPAGITCRDVESSHGFSISRQKYQLF